LRPRAAAAALVFLAASAAGAQTRYVAIGDSITAGFQGNCLVERNQVNSFPAIIARQLGITDFQLPTVTETTTITNPAIGCLGAVVANNTISVGPVSQPVGPNNLALPRPYDNLGVPGFRVSHVLNLRHASGTDTANFFASFILRNSTGPLEGTSALDQAQLRLGGSSDLATVWIGNNDVLNGVLSGIPLDGVTTTPLASFEADYTTLLEDLAAFDYAEAERIVTLNVPAVTALPFATTIPPVVVNPVTRQPVLDPNGNTIPLLGSRTSATCPTAPCPIPPTTLVTLQAQSMLATGRGIPCAVAPLPNCNQPLPDGSFTPPATLTPGVLLYADEVAFLTQRVLDINAIIAEQSAAVGATEIDIYAIFNEIRADGLTIGGVELSGAFLSGGLFSADGFHPSTIAHGIIADRIIQAINRPERPNLANFLFTPNTPGTVHPLAISESWSALFTGCPPQEGVRIDLSEAASAEPDRAPVQPIRRGRRP
ncbi:MAG TPA: SGNH/GDSL hydrolase family protein, partial [Thermoanaerobaculia bacterium]